MQQWIPKGHTLEPKIWGEMGLRQGLYVGLGILLGATLFFALGQLGIWARIAGLTLPPCSSLVFGFSKVKGLVPERYLFHRLRFRLCRADTLGVWDNGTSLGSPGEVWLGEVPEAEPATAGRSRPAAPASAPTRPKPSVAVPVAYLVEAGPFGLLFTAAAWAIASAVLAHTLSIVVP